MPFYEYQCENCGHTLEAMQKVNDAPLKKCPECAKPQLTRLMSAPVFRLKGGGWYETDFKSDQDQKKNLADRPEAEPVKEEKAAAADAKPEAAKEAVKPAEKAADKPAAEASPAQPPKKAGGNGISKRGSPAKPAKVAVKKPAARKLPATRRQGAKAWQGR